MEWNPYDRNCPTRMLLDRIGDRWTALAVNLLRGGPRRFSELRRSLDGISEKVLTQTLRGLERDGIVSRSVQASVPVRVDYALTDLGTGLADVLGTLTCWAAEHMDDVLAAREAYEAQAKGQEVTAAGSGK